MATLQHQAVQDVPRTEVTNSCKSRSLPGSNRSSPQPLAFQASTQDSGWVAAAEASSELSCLDRTAKPQVPAILEDSEEISTRCRQRQRRRILLVVEDGSMLPGSRAAFQFVCSRVMDIDEDMLLILHCRPNPCTTAPVDGLYTSIKRVNAEERRGQETAKAVLEEFHCMAGRVRLNYFRLMSVCGEIREKVVETALKECVDMVVVCCKAKSSLRLLHGTSLSDYCLHHCPCPVLVVREPNPGLCR